MLNFSLGDEKTKISILFLKKLIFMQNDQKNTKYIVVLLFWTQYIVLLLQDNIRENRISFT